MMDELHLGCLWVELERAVCELASCEIEGWDANESPSLLQKTWVTDTVYMSTNMTCMLHVFGANGDRSDVIPQ